MRPSSSALSPPAAAPFPSAPPTPRRRFPQIRSHLRPYYVPALLLLQMTRTTPNATQRPLTAARGCNEDGGNEDARPWVPRISLLLGVKSMPPAPPLPLPLPSCWHCRAFDWLTPCALVLAPWYLYKQPSEQQVFIAHQGQAEFPGGLGHRGGGDVHGQPGRPGYP